MTSIFERLPNTFGIGAAKSGTSSLADMLRQHPEVFVPHAKEPHFFNDDDRFGRGLDWLSNKYYKNSEGYKIRFDGSNAYLHWSEKVVDRLLATYENTKSLKFFALFRDPVERAYSHYWMGVRVGKEKLSFAEALRKEDERLKLYRDEFYRLGLQKFGYFKGSSYASNLQPYLKAFSKDQLHFLILEDLKNDQPATMKKLFDFLDVGEYAVTSQHKNPASLPRSQTIFNYIKFSETGAKRVVRSVVPQSVRKGFRSWLLGKVLKPIDVPPIPEDVEAELRERFRPGITELEAILDRDLSFWSK